MAQLKINDALNKVYLRQKPLTEHFNHFCEQLDILKNALENSKEKKESEEHIKNLIIKFLQDSFYAKTNLVNTKERIDCAIYETLESSSPVQVLIEAKRPGSNEFPSLKNLNSKALQETVLYYMRERVLNKNLDIKHIVITDGFQWFMFEATDFEKYFRNNKDLQKHYKDFEINPTLFSDRTSTFYSEIASPIIDKVKTNLPFVYFDICNLTDQLKISVYKLLSPQHLLRRFVCNDSNELNTPFYNELLYILGLEEVADGSKKKICRLKPSDRKSASFIENAIDKLEIAEPNPDRQFEKALSLTITWINRILFLKLLESQLVNYHKGDRNYCFLNTEKIKGFDDLQQLFFKVLAVPTIDRKPEVAEKYRLIPYLNSSLFELTDDEKDCQISGMRDDTIPVYNKTVLYDNRNSKRLKGELQVLDYLFRFLDAYDFGSEPDDDSLTRDNRKSIINASVLGLIFEKINGYKDGSFFTPGFITQYMCRESLRRTVVQKFNDAKGWQCQTFDELADKDLDKKEANQIINSLRICDPAVGSGHFLVSALNELIAIKADLKVLLQTDGKRLRYGVSVENDELMIDDDGEPFVYNPKNAESQLVQESLFAEKLAIIENCLFGVDINPNSVNICRLRLWIELLKNAYYKQDGEFETLPNIDINIKCGNSLVSRYPVKIGDSIGSGDSLSVEIKNYKACVKSYKHENDKAEKQKVKEAIKKIKEKIVPNIQFKLELDASYAAENREAMKNNIYRNSMEWMIEFPEVLDDEGRFNGFDVVIGNPPYGTNIDSMTKNFEKLYPQTSDGYKDIYKYFFNRGLSLLKSHSYLNFITPNTFFRQPRYGDLRRLLLKHSICTLIDLGNGIFDEAVVMVGISLIANKNDNGIISFADLSTIDNKKGAINNIHFKEIKQSAYLHTPNNTFIENVDLYSNGIPLEKIMDFKDAGINYQRVNVGLSAKGKSDLSSRLLYEGTQENSNDVEYWKGTDINSYFVSAHTQRFCRRNITLRDNEHVTLNEEYFNIHPKLIWRQTASHTICAIDYNGIWFGRSIQGGTIKPEYSTKITYEYLCGLLNSKYIRHLYSENVKEDGRPYPQVKLEKIKPIPIMTDTLFQQPIVNLVKQIIAAKKQNPQANTESLEREIDMRVYKLYGLTLEEAQVIDASVTAEDFDKY